MRRFINNNSFGDVSSRVVRHLKSCEVFNTPELAQKRADELEEKVRELGGTR